MPQEFYSIADLRRLAADLFQGNYDRTSGQQPGDSGFQIKRLAAVRGLIDDEAWRGWQEPAAAARAVKKQGWIQRRSGTLRLAEDPRKRPLQRFSVQSHTGVAPSLGKPRPGQFPSRHVNIFKVLDQPMSHCSRHP